MVEQVASLVAKYDDQVSAGAKAAADAINRVGAAADYSEQRVTRATKSGEQLSRQYDENARLAAKVEQITARYARELSDLEKSELSLVEKERLRVNILGQQEVAIRKTTDAHKRWVDGMRASEAAAGAQSSAMNSMNASAAAAQRALGGATSAFGGFTGAAKGAFDSISSGGGVMQTAVGQMTGMTGGMGAANIAAVALGSAAGIAAGGIGLMAAASVKAGDEMTRVEGRLRATTGSVGAARDVYDQLYQISQRTGIAVAESAGQFVRFNIAASQIGATRDEVVKLVDTVQKFGVVSGASTQEAQAAAMQLGQALASGKLQGDELRSILENMPVMAQALSKELGVSIGKLREMGTAGELTSDRVFRALLRSGKEASEMFEMMPLTVDRATSIMTSAWGKFTAEIDRSLGRSQTLARTIKYVADQLDRLARNQTASGQFDAVSNQISELQGRKSSLESELNANNSWGFSVGTFVRNNLELVDIDKRIARLQAQRDALGETVREEQKLEAQLKSTERAHTATASASAAQTAATASYKDTVKGLYPLEDALIDRNKKRAEVMAALDAGLISFSQAQKDNAAIEDAYKEKVESITHAQRDAAKAAGEREKAESKLEKQILAAVKVADAKAVEEYNRIMAEGKRVYESTRTPAEKYADTLVDLNRLLSSGAIDQDTFNRAVQASDPAFQKMQKVMEDSANIIPQTFDKAFDRVGDSIADAFVKGKGAAVDFKNVMDGVLSSIMTDLIKFGAINPFKDWLFGTTSPSLWNAAGGSAANQNSPASGLLSAGSSPLSLGSFASNASGGWLDRQLGGSITSASNWLNTTAYGGTGAVLNTGAVQQTAAGLGTGSRELASNAMPLAGSPGTGGVTYGDMLGGGMYGLGAVMSFANGNVASGLGNTAAAAMSFIPGLQAFAPIAAIGGALLQGLFGKNRGSPAAGAAVQYNGLSQTYAASATDNNGDPQQAAQLLSSIDAATKQFISITGGKTTGEFGIGVEAKDGKYRVREGGASGQLAGSYGTLDEAVIAGFRYNVGKGLIDASDDVLKAVTKSTKTDINEFMADVSFAQSFRAQFDAMNAALDPVNNQIKTFTENAKAIGESVKTNITDWKDTAKELGLATDEELVVAARKGITAMMGLGPAVEPLRGMAAVTKHATIEFEQYRPALEALGYTTAEVADLATQYTQKLTKAYSDSVAYVQRAGSVSIEQLIDPTVKTTALDRLQGLGLDRTSPEIEGIAKAITSVEDAARTGSLTIEDERAALATLNAALENGYLTADQYSASVGYLTTAWQDSTTIATSSAAKITEAANDNRSAWQSVVSSSLSAAQSAQSAWEGTAKSLATARQSLLVGDLSALSPLEKYNVARSQFDAMNAAAAGGDQQAMADLPNAVNAFLTASKAYNATNAAYAADFSMATDALQHSESIASQQLTAAKSQVSYLSSIDASLKSLDATAAEQSKMADILSSNRTWSAKGYESNITANMQLALKTGYDGNFGAGEFNAWIMQQPESTKAIARQVLSGLGQSSRIGFASGTTSAPPGWAWVGEQGPELMRFGGGESVIPNAAAVSMARSWETAWQPANDRRSSPNVMPFRGGGNSASMGGVESRLDAANQRIEKLTSAVNYLCGVIAEGERENIKATKEGNAAAKQTASAAVRQRARG